MRQVWTTKHGRPDVLEVREAPDPEPQAGEVRILVHAAGVNFADVLIRLGIYPNAPKLPAVVGYEVAGEVDAVGDGVESVKNGTRVLALTAAYGGYSEMVTISASEVVPIPDSLTCEHAAAIPVNYLTAWIMLIRLGNVQAGERVLVHSAAGGVGQAAVQLCLWRRAHVIGTASTAKQERLRKTGVEHCVDYRTQDFEQEVHRITDGEGVDIVLDAVGGRSFAKSYRCLAPLGRLFVYGVSSAVTGPERRLWPLLRTLFTMPRFKPLDLLDHNRGVFGVNLGRLGHKASQRVEMLREIVGLAEGSQLNPIVDTTFPFDSAPAAHQYMQDRKNFGKVLLIP